MTFTASQQRFEEIIKSLNEPQKQAVLFDTSMLQILAGPGSGKTRALVYRTIYFFMIKKFHPSNIMVTAFTRKAAQEMKERLRILIGPENTDMLQIGTFHSICKRVLQSHASIVDLSPDFGVANEKECEWIITGIRGRAMRVPALEGMGPLTSEDILRLISYAKNTGLSIELFATTRGFKPDLSSFLVDTYYEYQEKLKEKKKLDYDDLLIKACELSKKCSTAFSSAKVVLIDEFQDTNVIQYDLLKTLLDRRSIQYLTVVGDPDQSIYGFRSALPRIFTVMQRNHPGTLLTSLSICYRSTQNILAAASHVIAKDSSRTIAMPLYTKNPAGGKVHLIQTPNEYQQAHFIACEVNRIIQKTKGLISYNDIAVLAKENDTVRQLKEAFMHRRIPFKSKHPVLFQKDEVARLISYLRFSLDPSDERSFRHIINVPDRNISKDLLSEIRKNHTPGKSVLDTIRKMRFASVKVRIEIQRFILLCEHIQRKIKSRVSIPVIIDDICGEIKYKEYLTELSKGNPYKLTAMWNNVCLLVTLSKRAKESQSYFHTTHQCDEETVVRKKGLLSIVEEEEEDEAAKEEPLAIKQEEMEMDLLLGFSDDDDFPNEDILPFSQNTTPNTTQTTAEDETKNLLGSLTSEQLDSIFDYDRDEKMQDNYGHWDEKFADAGDNVSKSERFHEEDETVESFLKYVSLFRNTYHGNNDNSVNRVTISTIHSAKGLEWPCVLVASCNLEVFEEPEDCRLLYVAMTRAKCLLYCVYSDVYTSRKSIIDSYATDFLLGAPGHLFTHRLPKFDVELLSTMRRMLRETPTAAPDDPLNGFTQNYRRIHY